MVLTGRSAPAPTVRPGARSSSRYWNNTRLRAAGWSVPTVANLAMDSFAELPATCQVPGGRNPIQAFAQYHGLATPNLTVRDMNFTALAEWS